MDIYSNPQLYDSIHANYKWDYKLIEEFAKKAFEYASLDWKKYVITDEKYFRPNEVNYLLGDSSKARKELGWDYTQTLEEGIRKTYNWISQQICKETITSATLKNVEYDLLASG